MSKRLLAAGNCISPSGPSAVRAAQPVQPPAYRVPELREVGDLWLVQGRSGPNRDRYGAYYRIYA